jgi:hypothetical protein
MERIAALSTGTKLMLGSGLLLFLDLFFTWQKLPQHFGSFEVTASLDGWDRLGLLLGLLTLGLLTVVFVRQTDAELSPDVPWNGLTLVLAALVLVVAVLKNVTDAHSAWAAYVGLVFGALAAAGAYLDRDAPPPEPRPIDAGTWKPRVRAAPGAARGNGTSGTSARAAGEPESPPTRSASRW